MKKNSTNIILAFSFLMLIILIGVFVYVFSVIRNKNIHTSSVVAALDQRILENNNIGVFDKKMSDLKNTNDLMGSFIVDKSNIDKFVEYLENLGTSNDVDLAVKSVDTPKNEKNKILVNLSMVGDFSNIMKVIALLESSQYSVTMSSSYVSKDTPDVEGGSVTPKTDSPNVIKKIPWNADISFTVLSL
jgi:hypothetical protein